MIPVTRLLTVQIQLYLLILLFFLSIQNVSHSCQYSYDPDYYRSFIYVAKLVAIHLYLCQGIPIYWILSLSSVSQNCLIQRKRRWNCNISELKCLLYKKKASFHVQIEPSTIAIFSTEKYTYRILLAVNMK